MMTELNPESEIYQEVDQKDTDAQWAERKSEARKLLISWARYGEPRTKKVSPTDSSEQRDQNTYLQANQETENVIDVDNYLTVISSHHNLNLLLQYTISVVYVIFNHNKIKFPNNEKNHEHDAIYQHG